MTIECGRDDFHVLPDGALRFRAVLRPVPVTC
jgi:hypothetical protein